MSNEVTLENWFGLNDQLLGIGRKVIAHLSAPGSREIPRNAILAGFARKAIKTLEGIQLLAKHDAWEEAQVLTRVVFEVRVTFDCFWEMLKDKPEEACRRVFDAMMLEKMKQIRSYSNEQFQGGINRSAWDTANAQISRRYSPGELELLKKNGFTGQSIEQRSQKAGHSHAYQIMYRNLSRNVHGTDFTEQLGELVFGEADLSGYRRVRNHTVLFVGNWSASGIVYRADIDELCQSEMVALNARQQELKSVFDTFTGTDSPNS